MDYINAFWVGGLICALVQILMEKTKMMPGRIMVLLVVTGAVLSALGKCVNERRKRSSAGTGIFRPFCGRLPGRSCGNLRSADLRLSGKSSQ